MVVLVVLFLFNLIKFIIYMSVLYGISTFLRYSLSRDSVWFVYWTTAESWCTPYYYFQVMHFCHILDLRFQFEIQFSVLLGV